MHTQHFQSAVAASARCESINMMEFECDHSFPCSSIYVYLYYHFNNPHQRDEDARIVKIWEVKQNVHGKIT